MRKEIVNTSGKGRETVFHPSVVAHRKPKIVAEVIREGVRHYRDDTGSMHVADIVDQVFGKPDPSVMNLKRKGIVQRKFRR